MTFLFKFFILAAFFITLYSCNNEKNEKLSAISKDPSSSNQVQSKITTPQSNWKNPIMTPIGSDLASMLRAYYIIGEYDKMLPFLIWPKEFNKKQIKNHIQNTDWGYEIKVTNVHWNKDSYFTLTVKTTIQNTQSSETYEGKIENDTAKLMLNPESPKLFTIKK